MKILRLSVLLLGASILLNSCIKKTYDAPPDTSSIDPNLTVSCSVNNLTTEVLNSPGSGYYRQLGDSIISGVVIADDRSGNFYKQIIIDDGTAGIVLTMDKTYLYSDFPIGRKVYIKTKGLYLVNYNSLPEIVYGVSTGASFSTTGIPSALIGNYVVKGKYPVPVEPIDITDPDAFFGSYQQYYNRLVKLHNLQFEAGSNGRTYANSTASGSSATTLFVGNCDHSITGLAVYNSSYATFQPYITPDGNGDLIFIASQYKNTRQLLIRDTTDVRFTNPRCP